MLRSSLYVVVVVTATCIVVSLPYRAVQAADTLDLLYDPATSKLTTVPTAYDLKIISTSGLFTGVPTARVYDYYEHFLSTGRYYVGEDKPLELGPIVKEGVTLDELARDLCVEATHSDEYPIDFYDVVRLNGQVFQSEPVTCQIPPRQFPPFTGERAGILQYQSVTGDLRLRSQTPITALQIESSGHRFTGIANEGVFIGVADVNRPDKLFKLMPSGMVRLDYGPVMQAGLANNEFLSDICVDGAGSAEALSILTMHTRTQVPYRFRVVGNRAVPPKRGLPSSTMCRAAKSPSTSQACLR